MDSRLIFLHRQQRFEVRQDAFWKAIVPLEVDVLSGSLQGGEAIYDAEVAGQRAKKSRRSTMLAPVLKLTQVGVMKILRRSRERW